MFVIRKAELSDVDALYELYTNHLTATPPAMPRPIADWKELLAEITENPGYFILVGEDNGVVVSSVTLLVVKNLTHNLRPYALIENVVTHALHRNKGYAARLMDEATEICRCHHCYKIMLMTGSKHESTLHFYQGCGFNAKDKTAFVKWL